MTEHTIYLIVAFVAIVTVFLVVSEVINRTSKLGLEFSRKIFHLTAGTACIAMVLVFEDNLPIIIIGSLFAIVLPLTILLNIFSIQRKDRGWGTVFFAVAFVIQAMLFWERKDIFVSALVVLTYGDAFAAIVGKLKGRRKYSVGKSYKTLEGSFTFFIISYVGVFATLYFFESASIANILWISFIGALFSTLVEATSTSDFDNATIPLTAGTVLHLLLNNSANENTHFILGLLLFLVVALASIRLRFVDTLGSIGVFFIFTVIHGIGGWMWVAPLLFFFVSVSVMGRVEERGFDNPFVEKKGKRDIKQVYSKGLICLILTAIHHFYPSNYLFYIYIAVIATAHSDTWSSALGSYSKAQTLFTIPFGKQVPKGKSGGISGIGFLGGILGAAILALFAFSEDSKNVWTAFGIIIISAVGGNLMDSFLGSTVQGTYRCDGCEQITEAENHCDEKETELLTGFRWINNDIVNLMSGSTGCAISYLLLYLLE